MSLLEELAPILIACAVVALGAAGALGVRVALRRRAGRELGVDIPRCVRVRLEREQMSPGQLALGLPRWERAKADGTRDLRTGSMEIVRPASTIRVGRWLLADTSPFTIYHLALRLREAGTDVAPCPQELDKLARVGAAAEGRLAARSVDELVARFSECPTDFELLCADLLRSLGREVEVTPPSNDGGYDLRATDPGTGRTCIVECKCYARGRSVSRPLVQKLVGANDAVGADAMLFITTSSFSAGAREYAAQVGVGLVDGDELVRLCAEAWGGERRPAVSERDAWLTDAEIRLLFPADM